jgi:hypothetical protein
MKATYEISIPRTDIRCRNKAYSATPLHSSNSLSAGREGVKRQKRHLRAGRAPRTRDLKTGDYVPLSMVLSIILP